MADKRVFSTTQRPADALDSLLALCGQRVTTLGDIETWRREEPRDLGAFELEMMATEQD